jgi:hypothetical protein
MQLELPVPNDDQPSHWPRPTAGPGSARARRVGCRMGSGGGCFHLWRAQLGVLRFALGDQQASNLLGTCGFSSIHLQALSRPWAMRSPFQA